MLTLDEASVLTLRGPLVRCSSRNVTNPEFRSRRVPIVADRDVAGGVTRDRIRRTRQGGGVEAPRSPGSEP